MPLNVLNFALTQTVLSRDRPDLEPARINELAVMSALIKGPIGLMVPFIASQSIKRPDPDGPTDGDGKGDGKGDGNSPPPGGGGPVAVTATAGPPAPGGSTGGPAAARGAGSGGVTARAPTTPS